MAPEFKHECEQCVFLGTLLAENGAHDLYFCTQASLSLPTVIARYGDKGSDYKSGMRFTEEDVELHVARILAAARGLI